jgi:hypothetical protein
MTIWLASYPRSGNTCARIALRYLFGIPSRSIYPEHDMEELGPVIGELPPEMDVETASECCFLKTHEMPGEDHWPAISGLPFTWSAMAGTRSFPMPTMSSARSAGLLPDLTANSSWERCRT